MKTVRPGGTGHEVSQDEIKGSKRHMDDDDTTASAEDHDVATMHAVNGQQHDDDNTTNADRHDFAFLRRDFGVTSA